MPRLQSSLPRRHRIRLRQLAQSVRPRPKLRTPNISSIYRHAHATGLFGRRRLNIRFALERIVERVGEVTVTASAILRSVRAITRINDAGEWVDPPLASSSPAKIPRASEILASQFLSRQPKIQSSAPPIFEPALLEEMFSDEAPHAEQHPEVVKRVAEKLRKVAKVSAPPTIYTIKLSPELAAAREERQRGLEADRRALEAKNLTLAAAHTSHSLNRK